MPDSSNPNYDSTQLTMADVSTAVDLALRIGDVKMTNGVGAAEVSQAMRTAARAAGLAHFEVDVTYTGLSMTSHDGPESQAHNRLRVVPWRPANYRVLHEIDQVIFELTNGWITRTEAWQRVVTSMNNTDHRPYWRRLLAWGGLCAGVSLMIGGGALVCTVAFGTAIVIALIGDWFYDRSMPRFYGQVMGGMFAALVAAALKAADLVSNPSLVITSGIIMLLAGGPMLVSLQDALSEYYVSGNARLMEAMFATAGIFVGVAAGLSVGGVLFGHSGFEPGLTVLQPWPLMILGAAITGASCFYASHGSALMVPAVAALSLVAGGLFRLGTTLELGPTWSTAMAAGVVGWGGTLLASWLGVSFQALRTCALVPLLPGIAIFRALALMQDFPSFALASMLGAAGIALALASGSLLGEYIATPMTKWRGFTLRRQ